MAGIWSWQLWRSGYLWSSAVVAVAQCWCWCCCARGRAGNCVSWSPRARLGVPWLPGAGLTSLHRPWHWPDPHSSLDVVREKRIRVRGTGWWLECSPTIKSRGSHTSSFIPWSIDNKQHYLIFNQLHSLIIDCLESSHSTRTIQFDQSYIDIFFSLEFGLSTSWECESYNWL